MLSKYWELIEILGLPLLQWSSVSILLHVSVDCRVSDWELVPGTCDAPCGRQGSGIQRRQVIRNKKGSGQACPVLIGTVSCRGEVCPGKLEITLYVFNSNVSVDCLVSDWKWVPGSCNARCGKQGYGNQVREITRAREGKGQACPTLKRYRRICQGLSCPGKQKT